MRNLVLALLVVGLLAVPSLGVINVKVTADKLTLNNTGTDSAVVTLWAQGTAAGIYAAAGDIVATGDAVLGVPASGMAWVAEFSPNIPPSIIPIPGTPSANGTVINWGSQQTSVLAPNANYGKADYVALGSYTVVAGTTAGVVTLTVFPKKVSGYKFIECDKIAVMGSNLGVTMTVTPEPVTMALLALGGLVLARRRR